MKRRTFLKSASIAAIVAAFPNSPTFSQEKLSIVDMHTHIFNINDLPWKSFIWTVVFHNHEELASFQTPERQVEHPQVYLAGTLVLLTYLFREMELKTELAGVKAEFFGSAERVLTPDNSSAQQLFTDMAEVLASALRQLFEEKNGAQFVRDNCPVFNEAQEWMQIEVYDLEIDPEATEKALRDQINFEVSEMLESQVEPNWFEVAGRLITGKGVVARWLEFGRDLLRDREQNLAELVGRYTTQNDPILVTPAIVDFSGWLDEEPKSHIVGQVALNDKLQGITPANVLMQQIVAYNPWRQLQFENDTEPYGVSPIRLIKDAILNHGAVGVKLYPPMGFLPYMNSARDVESFLERAVNDFGQNVGVLMDEALEKLYTLCAEIDVPILAHANCGNSVRPEFGQFARPSYWQEILEYFEHDELRVCMAHFGGFDGRNVCGDENSGIDVWEADIAAMLQNGTTNVYCDLSYLTAVLPNHANHLTSSNLARLLMNLFENNPSLKDRLLFGSDWHMLSKEPGHAEYQQHMRSHLQAAGLNSIEMQKVFSGNALDFFGIRPNRPSFQRLSNYYSHDQQRLETLQCLSML